ADAHDSGRDGHVTYLTRASHVVRPADGRAGRGRERSSPCRLGRNTLKCRAAMNDCDQIDLLITPYVDGDISSANAVVVNRHLQPCRVCCGRVQAEQAVQALMRERRPTLISALPPSALRMRCAALASTHQPGLVPRWRADLKLLAIAAGLVLVVAAAGIYG